MGNEINSDNMNLPYHSFRGVPDQGRWYRFRKYYPGEIWEEDNLIIRFQKYCQYDVFTPNFKVGMLLIDVINEETQNLYTMDELGKIAGVSAQSIRKYITSKKKGQFDYPEIPMKVLVNLSRHLRIPLVYFTDNNIPYTEDPKSMSVRDDYYHTIPIQTNKSGRGRSYLGDLYSINNDHANQSMILKGKNKLSEIENRAGLTPVFISSLSDQSLEKLTKLICEAVSYICDIERYSKE